MFHPRIDQTVDLMMGNEPAETSTILPPCQGAYCNLHMVQELKHKSQVAKPEYHVQYFCQEVWSTPIFSDRNTNTIK